MVRLARWRFVLAAALVVVTISSPAVRAQDAAIVTAPSPEATAAANTAAPVATEAAAIPLPVATEAVPVATEAATLPVAIQTAAPLMAEAPVETPPPAPVPTSTEATSMISAAVTSPVSTDAPTTEISTAAPSATSQVAADTSVTILEDAGSSGSSLRGSEAESSASSSSRDASDTTTGTLEGSSATKMLVIAVLGGIGLTIIISLLFVVRRIRTRQDSELDTPLPPPDTCTITFPDISMPSAVAPTAPDIAAWKASGSSFSSRDLPLSNCTRAKLNATTRSSTEYDLADQPSQIVSIAARGTATQAARGTNASSEQSFSIRGYSEFSMLHGGDSEAFAMANDRISATDGNSMSDRYSTIDRYSTSSRLSSEPGRSNSGWFQRQVPKNLDMHRFSTTSSTASSVVAMKHNPATLINHDLTRTPSVDVPVDTDSTRSRTDIPDWYSVIESPTDNDRYTASSLDSDNVSNERESFEL